MDDVHIMLTHPAAETMGEFVHGSHRFVFCRLDGEAPPAVADAPLWAFVDWVMEDMAGLEMCRRLRADPRTGAAHITMVLECDDGDDRRRALKAGADDYMIGPVDRTRVLDRVLAIGTQFPAHSPQRVTAGELAIEPAAQQARWAGKLVTMPPNEFRLLRFFAENPNVVFTRQDLIAGLGKQDPPLDARTVDVWIGRLRRALKAAGASNPLRTVRSVGYVLDVP